MGSAMVAGRPLCARRRERVGAGRLLPVTSTISSEHSGDGPGPGEGWACGRPGEGQPRRVETVRGLRIPWTRTLAGTALMERLLCPGAVQGEAWP